MTTRCVEVLVFEGCPNTDAALDQVRAAMKVAAVNAQLRVVLVQSEDDARRLRFLGSPSVRVDGMDVEASARMRSNFGLQCRIYAVDGRRRGTPPRRWIVEALQRSTVVEETH